MPKPKVLFVTSRLPYPPVGGDRIRSYWLLKLLSKYYKVHLVSIAEIKDKIYESEFHKFSKDLGIEYKLFYKSKLNFYYNTIKSVFNNLPLQVNYYYFSDVQQYINDIYVNYDLIFSVLVRTAKYVLHLNKPKILDMTDLISLNYKRSIKKTYSSFWKLLYFFEIPRLVSFEKKCLTLFNNVILVNKEEIDYLEKKLGIVNNLVYIPNGVNPNLFNYNCKNSQYSSYVSFLGKLDYQPNNDSVLWFIKNVLPYLDKRIKFAIIGPNPSKKLQKIARKNKRIELLGFLKDPYCILKSSIASVVPLQTGGGIQNKVLESMALGCITIVSSLAAKPIGATHMKEYIIEDNPQKMAEIINDIYKNPDKYMHIKHRAREFIKRNFSWAIVEKELISLVEKIVV